MRDPRLDGHPSKQTPAIRGLKELKTMSFTQLRTDVKRAVNRRRMYARINALPDSTVRNELLAIARRHEDARR